MKGQNPSLSVLKPSVYSFCFRYTIPRIDLPPSYEAKHGYIRYWMQASIKKKKGKSKIKTAKQVFDIGGYNEYDEEELKEMKDRELQSVPNARETATLIGVSCYPTGSLTLSARTNKFLYHPCEVITTHVTTGNEAYRGARIIEASLVRLTEYDDGKSNKTHSKQEVVRVEKEVENTGEKDLQLVLPAQSLQPTMMRACKCIKVSYYLKVRMKINGKKQKKSALMIPVVIIPSPVLPSPRPTTLTQLHSDLRKDSPYDSVSNITPGTLFYVTGSPYGNEWDTSAGSLYENKQHRSRRTSRVAPLDENTSVSFFFNDEPFISYV
ncbi:arrestin domain-containing protein 3-like isoform X1 [Actinia tenebrosa]|uniref:Arrestin domain-containing protein 3-like isoform X1 n=1 Tax=Actinia tenebrosa TaxID=6105 RepID=A0A6P8H8W7_ACTTE|nr:arrestin domain-containing protein 3-like isoform X1 [Actinia tenebrosa]